MNIKVCADMMNIKVYYDSEIDAEGILDNVQSNTVILATNLAGRCTDIDISENIERRGGLHVILGFYPRKLRIQQQAIGRTGRKGQQGSAIMLFQSPYSNDSRCTMEMHDAIRVGYEVDSLGRDRNTLSFFIGRDNMFKRIVSLINSDPSIRNEPGKLNGLQERFGVFIASLDCSKKESENIDLLQLESRKFDDFYDNLVNDLSSGKFSDNPCHYYLNVDDKIRRKDFDGAESVLNIAGDLKKSEGYHFRKAAILNNKGKYNDAKLELDAGIDLVREKAIDYYAGAELDRSSAAVFQGNDYLNNHYNIDPTVALQNIQGPQNINNQHLRNNLDGMRLNINPLQPTNNQVNNVSNGVAVRLNGVTEIGSRSNRGFVLNTINLTADAARRRVDDYLHAVNHRVQIMMDVIETNRQNNADDTQRVFVNLSTSNNSENDLAGVEVPVPKSYKKPEQKKKGWLGFILGGLSIIVGACLVLCYGGLLAAFGAQLVLNGLSFIKTNQAMNRNNAYDNGQIIKNAVVSIALSVITSYLSPLSYFGAMGGLANGVLVRASGLDQIMMSSSATEDVVTKSIQNATSGRRDFRDTVQDKIDEVTTGHIDGTDTERQQFVNEQTQQWYDNNLQVQLSVISPERIDTFYESMNPIVENQLEKLGSLMSNSFCSEIAVVTLIFMDECMSDNKIQLEDFAFKKSLQLQPENKVNLSDVIKYQDFDTLSSQNLITNDIINNLGVVIKLLYDKVKGKSSIWNYCIRSRQLKLNKSINDLQPEIDNFNRSPNSQTIESATALQNRVDAITLEESELISLSEKLQKLSNELTQNTILEKALYDFVELNLCNWIQYASVNACTKTVLLSRMNNDSNLLSLDVEDKDLIASIVSTDFSDPNSHVRVTLAKMDEAKNIIQDIFRPAIEQAIMQQMKLSLEASC